MARKTPGAPRKPRTPRKPNELSAAVKSYNALRRKQASRERLAAKVDALDIEILDLQNDAAEQMKTVNDAIYGPAPDAQPTPPAPVGA